MFSYPTRIAPHEGKPTIIKPLWMYNSLSLDIKIKRKQYEEHSDLSYDVYMTLLII